MARPPALKLAEVLAEIRMSASAFYRLRARGQAPRMIKLPHGELRCRRRGHLRLQPRPRHPASGRHRRHGPRR
ncbi:hypothetical protein ACNPQM_20930 [Streptomyces sp. NPDC056231]|uniref:hypothetical protein n=1 Tax=Streptomyces sp. NPDC056231 TaxID=3345755 RepID=UPI003AAEB378